MTSTPSVRLSEADTRTQLIDPALAARGWNPDLVRREVSAGAIEIVGGRPRRRKSGRADYVLCLPGASGEEPLPVALIEAKACHLPPLHGLDQGKLYAHAKRLNVPLVFATNGHRFVAYDAGTGKTTKPLAIASFPTPDEVRKRYEVARGFKISDDLARPLLTPYSGILRGRRYYQDAAIRATLEKLIAAQKRSEAPRALISLATGAGKTFITVALLRRLADAGFLRRALFICDRDELRSQAATAFQAAFGSDAAIVTSSEPQKNARILIATYQTLDLGDNNDHDDGDFILRNYGENYFSHIVIDECHRSAWGKWSRVLTLNDRAVQIGLTATPRQIAASEDSSDAEITADNIRHFGEPVYEYDMSQGIEDGYLAACSIETYDLFHDDKPVNERQSGVAKSDLDGKTLIDAITGQKLDKSAAKERYTASELEGRLVMPDRVKAMAGHLFERLIANGSPEQKTIIFCARDSHADSVAVEMNNLYADWCAANRKKRKDPYAFKCTAPYGSDEIPDFRGSSQHHIIATTVDLLTTGVDVPAVRNIVFFKYVKSAIAFYQMVGRGTRIDEASGKLMFRIFDYTNATRLFGSEFISKLKTSSETSGKGPPTNGRILEVEGFEVRVSDAGQYVVTAASDGHATPVGLEDYKTALAESLRTEVTSAEALRKRWTSPQERAELMNLLPDSGRSATLVKSFVQLEDCDLYDLLAYLAFGAEPLSRVQRAAAFRAKNEKWLTSLPRPARAVLDALVNQFERGGITELENPQVFDTPDVRAVGGLRSLKDAGSPSALLMALKERLFA